MEVTRSDLWVMLLSTVRYAMGRKSYVTGLASDLVHAYKKWLTTAQIVQIRNEVAEALRVAEEFGGKLGMDIDHEGWKKLVQELNAFLEHGEDEAKSARSK